MRKRKIKPGSFEDRATAKAELMEGPIDVGAIWKAERLKRDAEVDKELSPEVVRQLQTDN
jgi:hypothetical protein